jgi:hypothetical protein
MSISVAHASILGVNRYLIVARISQTGLSATDICTQLICVSKVHRCRPLEWQSRRANNRDRRLYVNRYNTDVQVSFSVYGNALLCR